MKFTLGWLHDHLETDATAGAIGDVLTDLGLELESLTDPAAALAPFVTARVLESSPHPNAERLSVCRVMAGDAEVQVVCGAPNARTGMIGVFAPPGTHIPGTRVDLKPAQIRGVESCGMLLSERELGMSDEHEGIIELPADTPIGVPFAQIADPADPVFDVAVTPNRPDALGIRGIARDLAARGVGTLRAMPTPTVTGTYPSPVGVSLAPDVADRACPLFVGRHFRGVRNGPSPDWMQQRLRAIGLRPLSALVDITNYLTYDRCRPLHVFDADRLTGNIMVRFANVGETLHALDDRTYNLDAEMLVIADDSGPLGLGGIIGGEATGCTDATSNVFLEAAYFDPVRTATTGRRLNVQSDARFRFERGIDPAFTTEGMEIATQLILEICGGEASGPVIAGAVPETTRRINFVPAKITGLLGMEIPEAEQARILTSLGFTLESTGNSRVAVPPAWRPDIGGEADLAEEVGRVASLAKLPATPLPRRPGVRKPALDTTQRRETIARRLLASRGMHECVCYSFIASADAKLFGGADAALILQNPISEDLDAMRPSLLPALLRAAAQNRARDFHDLSLFEVGAEFYGAAPDEQRRMTGGIRMGDAVPISWNDVHRAVDVFDVKADTLALLGAIGSPVDKVQLREGAAEWYHPGRSGSVYLGPKNLLAMFGELHPRVLAAVDLPGPVVAFELRIESVPMPKKGRRSPPPLVAPNYQAVERDFAFVVDESILAEQLIKAAKWGGHGTVGSVEVFDVFSGPEATAKLGEGKKSVAVRLRLQPLKYTLTTDEIERDCDEFVNSVCAKTGGHLQGAP